MPDQTTAERQDGRRYPSRPILGVGAVIVDGNLVLLARRAHEPLKGEWSLPGGGVEVGETLEAAVRREVLEETGLTIHVGPVVDIVDAIQIDTDRRVESHYVIVDYLCRAVGHDQPIAGSDASDVQWVRADDLASYHLTDKAMAVIAKALEMSCAR